MASIWDWHCKLLLLNQSNWLDQVDTGDTPISLSVHTDCSLLLLARRLTRRLFSSVSWITCKLCTRSRRQHCKLFIHQTPPPPPSTPFSNSHSNFDFIRNESPLMMMVMFAQSKLQVNRSASLCDSDGNWPIAHHFISIDWNTLDQFSRVAPTERLEWPVVTITKKPCATPEYERRNLDHCYSHCWSHCWCGCVIKVTNAKYFCLSSYMAIHFACCIWNSEVNYAPNELSWWQWNTQMYSNVLTMGIRLLRAHHCEWPFNANCHWSIALHYTTTTDTNSSKLTLFPTNRKYLAFCCAHMHTNTTIH